MKVKVHVKCVPFTETEKMMQDVIDNAHADLAAAYAKNEELLQQVRDLERQIVCMERDAKAMKERFATACAERDNWQASFKQVTNWWEEAVATKNRAENELLSTQIEMKDREERIFILEQRIGMLERENREWQDTANSLSAKVVTQADKITTYEQTVTFSKLTAAEAEIARLQEEVARLTAERDTAVRENTALIFENNELEENLEATVNIKNEYAEQIDTLRKEKERLFAKANDTTASFWNFLLEQGLVKNGEEPRKGNVCDAK